VKVKFVVKKNKKRTNRGKDNIDVIGHALDLMLAGHDSVIGPDFVLTKRGMGIDSAEIGYLDPDSLNTYDSDFINSLMKTQAEAKISIPDNLESLSNDYSKQRELLSEFHHEGEVLLTTYDREAANELGNVDHYNDNKIVIRNNAEMCVFYDYIALYRIIERKRTIAYWRMNNPSVTNKDNKAVVNAHEKARFSVLRIDQNLEHGVIKVTNLITKNEHLLIGPTLRAVR